MLTLKLITEETERVIRGLEKKHFDGAKEAIDNVLALDKERRQTQQQLDKNLQESKKMAAQIGQLMKEKKADEANVIKESVSKLKETSKALEHELSEVQRKLTELLCTIPNIPNDDVPEGKDASDNVVVKEGGVIPDLPEEEYTPIPPRHLRVYLYTLSADYYYYLKAIQDAASGSISGTFQEIGLAEPVRTHSNIEGGVGILGGCHTGVFEVAISSSATTASTSRCGSAGSVRRDTP